MCLDVWGEFIDSNEHFVNSSVFDLIEEMAPYLNDTVIECKWPYDGDTCSEIFVPVLTEEGLCFAFNILNSGDIYTDKYEMWMIYHLIVTSLRRPNEISRESIFLAWLRRC